MLVASVFAAAGASADAAAFAQIVHLDYSVTGDKVVVVGHKGESRGTYEEKDVIARLEMDVDSFPDVYQTAGGLEKGLKAYGICGLMQDRTSQFKGAANKFEAMLAEATRLREEGALWSETKEREVKAKAPKIDAYLAQAVAELKKVSVATATALLGGLDKENLAKLVANPAVVAKVDELKAAAQASGEEQIDMSDLFA
jgi:hypothetical protein